MTDSKCPFCGSGDIGNKWVKKGKLTFYCRDCCWEDEPRIPERIPLKKTKEVLTGNFLGWHFEGFDKYGHAVISSHYYNSMKEACKDIDREHERGKKDAHRGPYTIVLWPPTATIVGKVIEAQAKAALEEE